MCRVENHLNIAGMDNTDRTDAGRTIQISKQAKKLNGRYDPRGDMAPVDELTVLV